VDTLTEIPVSLREHEAFKRLEATFIQSQEIIQRQAKIITASKIGLLDAKQVADLTGYDEKTIRIKKEDIGYSTLGKNIKFRVEDVNNWIAKGYQGPRNAKY